MNTKKIWNLLNMSLDKPLGQKTSKGVQENVTGKPHSKKFGCCLVVIILFAIIVIASSCSKNQTSTSNTGSQQPTQSSRPKAEVKKELDELMDTAFKANLITSYEFSDTANVVFADSTWYTQTVAFKKDFLAKIATLKKELTGYHHFEVRDAYSNEKLAEVTSFSGSINIYK